MPTPRRFQTGLDQGTLFDSLNQNFDYIDNQERTRIIYNGGTPTLLLGYQSGGFGTADYGLKIAKPGVNVTTATNDQLAFSSAFDSLKIVASGTTTVTAPATSSSALGATNLASNYFIPHNLGYTPIVIAFLNTAGNSYTLLPYTTPPGTGTQISTQSVQLLVDSTQLVVTATTNLFNYTASANSAGSQTFVIKYYLLQETAN